MPCIKIPKPSLGATLEILTKKRKKNKSQIPAAHAHKLTIIINRKNTNSAAVWKTSFGTGPDKEVDKLFFSSLTTTQRYLEMERKTARRETVNCSSTTCTQKAGSKQHVLQLTLHPTLPIAVANPANPSRPSNLAKTTPNPSRTSLCIDA